MMNGRMLHFLVRISNYIEKTHKLLEFMGFSLHSKVIENKQVMPVRGDNF